MAKNIFEFKSHNKNVSDDELLNDLKRVVEKLSVTKLSMKEYDENGGKYTAGTIGRRFGSWNKALKKIGLTSVHSYDVSEEELFRNLEEIWIAQGKQPTFRNIKKSFSKYSMHQYVSKFGTWEKSLEKFVEYINSVTDRNEEPIKEDTSVEAEKEIIHKTKRIPNDRLKVQVLIRDGNKCKLCGITVIGENIHFDHIIPWSKGGETTLENLQVLCSKHNLAKGDLM